MQNSQYKLPKKDNPVNLFYICMLGKPQKKVLLLIKRGGGERAGN